MSIQDLFPLAVKKTATLFYITIKTLFKSKIKYLFLGGIAKAGINRGLGFVWKSFGNLKKAVKRSTSLRNLKLLKYSLRKMPLYSPSGRQLDEV